MNGLSVAPFTGLLLPALESLTPAYMQGRSFAAASRGAPPPADWRKATYYRYWMHLAHALRVPAHFGLRTDRCKLIFLCEQDSLEFKLQLVLSSFSVHFAVKDQFHGFV